MREEEAESIAREEFIVAVDLDDREREAPERGGRIESLLAELNRQKTDDDDHDES